jgi:hypothetical protein
VGIQTPERPWQLEGHELHMTSVRNENAYFSCIKDAPVGLGHGMAEDGRACRWGSDKELEIWKQADIGRGIVLRIYGCVHLSGQICKNFSRIIPSLLVNLTTNRFEAERESACALCRTS